MFKNYAYVSGTSRTQLDYFDWFVDYITEKFGSTPSNVLDIGCNDGSFLNAWGGSGVKTYGVDPAENLYSLSSKDHSVVCGFFTGKEFGSTKFDVVTCMNAFAHNSDQLTLLNNIKDRLSDNGLIFCTTSQANMILNGEFDTIYHEHLSFFNIKSAKTLCERAGLYLTDVYKHPIHGTSYIFVISKFNSNQAHVDSLIKEEENAGLYNPETYTEYAKKCEEVAQKFADTIKEYREKGYIIIGYGAAAKGNTLMNYVNEGPDFIFEDNPLKQGLYTPGMSLRMYQPFWLDPGHKYLWIPLAWNFYNEIVTNIKEQKYGGEHLFLKYFPEFNISE
jgi:2-polyprenyl-3-methyl-5-hydroxy-6-metoxy-1,4-benzoquinol methylase